MPPTTPHTPYTAAQCRQDYTPKLKRAQVLEIGTRFGLSETTMRALIEGDAAPVPRETFANQARGYFDREKLLLQLFPKG